MGPAAAAAHPMAGPRPALTPRAHALTPRAGKAPKGKKGLAREAGARGFKNASAAALAPRKPLCAAAHAGGQPGPRLGCDSSRGPGRGAKKARYHTGAFLAPSTYAQRARQPQHRQVQGQGVARGAGHPAAEPGKMQGCRRAKRLRARRHLLALAFLPGGATRFPRPGQAIAQALGRQQAQPKGIKRACWRHNAQPRPRKWAG